MKCKHCDEKAVHFIDQDERQEYLCESHFIAIDDEQPMSDDQIKLVIVRPLPQGIDETLYALQLEIPTTMRQVEKCIKMAEIRLRDAVYLDDSYRNGLAMVLSGLEEMRKSSALPLQPALGICHKKTIDG